MVTLPAAFSRHHICLGRTYGFRSLWTNFRLGVLGIYGATALWILGYDTIYAMQDLADDRQLPIHTMPKVLNGHIDRFIVVVYGSFWLIIGLYAYTITHNSCLLGLLVTYS